jgi:hypothetical protein
MRHLRAEKRRLPIVMPILSDNNDATCMCPRMAVVLLFPPRHFRTEAVKWRIPTAARGTPPVMRCSTRGESETASRLAERRNEPQLNLASLLPRRRHDRGMLTVPIRVRPRLGHTPLFAPRLDGCHELRLRVFARERGREGKPPATSLPKWGAF